MNHNVYDTCIRLRTGKQLHFDVLVRASQGAQPAKLFALDWLQSIGIHSDEIESTQNHFCHNAITTVETAHIIEQQGYAIIKSKGCPGYYC